VREFVFLDDRLVGCGIFFGDDFLAAKYSFNPERSIFPVCSTIALGHQDEMVAPGEILQSLRNVGQNLDRMVGDDLAKL